jgi:hypothetical protein
MRVGAAALAVVLLVGTAVVVLARPGGEPPPEGQKLRFVPRIAGSVCVRDPVMDGVEVLLRSHTGARLRVRWYLDTPSRKSARELRRELRPEGFAVEIQSVVPTEVMLLAVRSEMATRHGLRAAAETVKGAAARSSAELIWVETPPGGCDGRYIEENSAEPSSAPVALALVIAPQESRDDAQVRDLDRRQRQPRQQEPVAPETRRAAHVADYEQT